MSFWAAFPFLRYVFWLTAGIVAAELVQRGSSDAWWFTTGFLAICSIAWYFFAKSTRFYRSGTGILALALLFSFGYARMRQQKERLMPDNFPAGPGYWMLKAEADPVFTPKTVKVPATILGRKTENHWERVKGKALLYIRKEGLTQFPASGNTLVVWGEIKPVPPPLNPAVFDYKEYLALQGICCQAFITAENVQYAGQEPENPVYRLAREVRAWSLRKTEEHVEGKQEAAIVSSLVLGYRETLDDRLVQAYSTAGTMHVLAVSGLHVGFLYLFLKFIFRTWRRNPKIKWLSFLATILVLWAYAFVTGLSPSVMRAAWMFCMIDAAFLLKRKTSIYNTLAIAAFALLVLNPNMLRTVGFQLSFLAVAGIVYLQPRLASLYKRKNKGVRWLWDLLAVSLAAQFATFPLSLYYFGQFPSYFFLTNLVVVPLVSVILALGFSMLLLSLVSSSIAAAAGWLLHWLVWFVNYIAFTAEALPYSRLNTHISPLQLWLLMAGLVMLLIFFHFRKFRLAVLTFLLFSCFTGSLLWRTYQQKNQKKLLVYHIPGYSLLQLAEGTQEFFMGNEEVPPAQIQYQVNPNRVVLGGEGDKSTVTLTNDFRPALKSKDGYTFLVWKGIKLVKVTHPLSLPCPQQFPVEADFILLTHNTTEDLETLGCYFRGGTILIDGSNKAFIQKKLVKQAESLNLPYYQTSEKGAFELNL